jgi:hypothetical protein
MNGNENAQTGGPGARKISWNQRTQSQAAAAGNDKDYEDQRNAAACFKNKDKSEDWHADFKGVMVTEELPAGTKCWVNVYEKTDRYGRPYFSIVLRRWRR